MGEVKLLNPKLHVAGMNQLNMAKAAKTQGIFFKCKRNILTLHALHNAYTSVQIYYQYSSNITTPQDAHKRLVLQVYPC